VGFLSNREEEHSQKVSSIRAYAMVMLQALKKEKNVGYY
tara:strand:+ start:735 stop:851 length:117 start_codon:yes stop_codon:yes gene_type:complete